MQNSVAVLYQALDAPIFDGIRKPKKPGGYSDSGADIAYNLKHANVSVITPVSDPDSKKDFDWVFPDTAEGIQTTLSRGANLLWANTILFKGHPLEKLSEFSGILIIGQPPALMQHYDDKWITNEELKSHGLSVAPACLVSNEKTISSPKDLEFPVVIKPVRGRGSQGVVVVQDLEEYKEVLSKYFEKTHYGQTFIVEQFMPGKEVTITVMPPGVYNIKNQSIFKNYWSLPVVKRFNHIKGIAPYSGEIAIMENSALLDANEIKDSRYSLLQRECEKAAEIIKPKAPIRIDCREGKDGKFYLFDLNMKPNITGPGRPGRKDQDSLMSLAARSETVGWDYTSLLQNICSQAWPANLMLEHAK